MKPYIISTIAMIIFLSYCKVQKKVVEPDPSTGPYSAAKTPTLTTAQLSVKAVDFANIDVSLSKRINADSLRTAKLLTAFDAAHKADSLKLVAATKQIKETMILLNDAQTEGRQLSLTVDELQDALTKSYIATASTIDSMRIIPNPKQFTITETGATRILNIK